MVSEKIALLIGILLLATGCSRSISGWELKAANGFCEKRLGVAQYTSDFASMNSGYVLCNDGTRWKVMSIKGE